MMKPQIDADITFNDFHFGILTGICIGISPTAIHVLVPGKGCYELTEEWELVSVVPFIS